MIVMQYVVEAIVILFLAICIPIAAMPGLPALFIMFAISALYGYWDNFVHLTYANLAVLLILAIISFTFDTLSGIIGAKYGGADKKSLLYGWLGLILGTFLIPVPVLGSFIGLFLGIFLSELLFVKKEKALAFRSAVGGITGAIAGTFGNIFMALLFFVLFILFVIY